MRTISELAALIAAQAPSDGEHDTIVPRVGLIRSSAETEPIHTLYEPSCCIVAQGRKQARIGSETYVYDASHYLIVGIDLPAIGAVIEASTRAPYLCLRLELDRQVIGELVEARPFEGKAAAGAALSVATPQIVDACVRLLELIDAPEDVDMLAPLLERELLYRLLRGPQGDVLLAIAMGDSRLRRIGRAVDYIRRRYREAFTVEDLAAIAGMSASSFYEHFRAVTGMTALQFRTQIRLQEARRLMMVDGMTAAEAGFRVGYNSPSQFSREYARIHQLSPRRDVGQMKSSAL